VRLPTMTTRRWMIAVAIVGAVLVVGRRREEFRRKSREYGEQAAVYTERVVLLEKLVRQWRVYGEEGRLDLDWIHGALDPEFVARHQARGVDAIRAEYKAQSHRCSAKLVATKALAAYATRLKHKYEDAAAHPWLHVVADPPPPPVP
jgi:hypothetical protein